MTAYTAFFNDLFGVRKSVRYHQRRRSFFEWIHTSFAALQVVAGSSAVATWVAENGSWGIGLAASAALLAAIDLVVGTSRRATAHVSLAQRFAQLEREMVPFERDRTIGESAASTFRQQRLEIEESEPPKKRVIDILCHNELVVGVQLYHHWDSYAIAGWQRAVGHFVDIETQKILDNPIRTEDRVKVREAGAAAAS